MAAYCLAVGELAEHDHNIATASASLSGGFCAYSWDKGSPYGIVTSRNPNNHVQIADGGGKYVNFDIDASHNHTTTITTSGGNVSHENRPPYRTILCWQRTA